MTTSQKPFDLVVLDLDGTILDKRFEGGFSPAVIETIAVVQAAGIPVTIATGRVLDYVRTAAELLAITHPVVTTQGAVVAHPISGEVIFQALLPEEMALQAAQWVDDSGRITAFYLSNGAGGAHIFQNREEHEPDHYDHWLGSPRQLQPLFTELLDDLRKGTAFKFIVYNALNDEPDLTPILQQEFGPALQITRTHELLVEGTAAGVDKGQGLRHLLAHLGIDPSRVMAIGDNDNDIPMLEVAGFSVAMGQAPEKVKAVADWIAPPIEEDGAAVALRKFVLGKMGTGD
ncbi:MAG: HAD family phosphatase [Caldilineaceae bacterium]|nr:HAD family phosphatase [Caldilineaceae bacterium]